MIKPVNGHLLIEPIPHEEFIATDRGTYEEIGIVLGADDGLDVEPGTKVYFDAWLAAKYPKNGGKPDDFYWLVKWEDVRAVEHVVT